MLRSRSCIANLFQFPCFLGHCVEDVEFVCFCVNLGQLFRCSRHLRLVVLAAQARKLALTCTIKCCVCGHWHLPASGKSSIP